MSTRSEILIKCNYGEVKLYHHHDGYISGVGFNLYKRFFTEEEKSKYRRIDDVVNELVKDTTDEYVVTIGKHTDIEYFYEIDMDAKTLTGWQAHYEYDEHTNVSFLVKDVIYPLDTIEKLYKGGDENEY